MILYFLSRQSFQQVGAVHVAHRFVVLVVQLSLVVEQIPLYGLWIHGETDVDTFWAVFSVAQLHSNQQLDFIRGVDIEGDGLLVTDELGVER